MNPSYYMLLMSAVGSDQRSQAGYTDNRTAITLVTVVAFLACALSICIVVVLLAWRRQSSQRIVAKGHKLKPMVSRIQVRGGEGDGDVWDAELDWDLTGTEPVIAGFHENMTQTFVDGQGTRYRIDDCGNLVDREDPPPGIQELQRQHFLNGPKASVGTEATEDSAGIPPETIVSSVGYELCDTVAQTIVSSVGYDLCDSPVKDEFMNWKVADPKQSGLGEVQRRRILDVDPIRVTTRKSMPPGRALIMSSDRSRSSGQSMSAEEITAMLAEHLREFTDDSLPQPSEGHTQFGGVNAAGGNSSEGDPIFTNIYGLAAHPEDHPNENFIYSVGQGGLYNCFEWDGNQIRPTIWEQHDEEAIPDAESDQYDNILDLRPVMHKDHVV